MKSVKTIVGLTVIGLVCTAGMGHAIQKTTNTVSIDSTTLGPAWVDPADPSHAAMMSAIMNWKKIDNNADGVADVTPFGSGADYVPSKTGGLGALTSDAIGCGSLGPNGGIQDNVTINSAGIYEGFSLDDGSNHGVSAGRDLNGVPILANPQDLDPCGNFSSSPQTAGPAGFTATGTITQDINFQLSSDDSAIVGDRLDIVNGSVNFSMTANGSQHTVNDFGTTINQDTEFTTTYTDNTDTGTLTMNLVQQSQDINASGAKFVADNEPEEFLLENTSPQFNLTLDIENSLRLDLPGGPLESFIINQNNETGTVADPGIDYLIESNMPPGFY